MQARGRTIRRRREECGFNLTAFAHLVGISPSYLSRIENEKSRPGPDVLKRIALALQSAPDVRDAIAKIARHETEGSDDDSPGG
ncbi:hypothetical protein CG740_23415 [Streptomyces sp. CB01201]|uniref:helix-turn-helix domain-containing protein n=1 Tax=Streptomyces sp. CB01201 TaxID=2020324 RepID=UPI000C277EAA|nr:hypothetical protein CG740_23415 [Streptomyces sp. CB01201]